MTTLPLAPQRHEIRKAASSGAASVAAVLSRAFQEDPVMRWIVPDDDRRRRVLPPFFELYTTMYLAYDEVYVRVDGASGDGVGAALWAPPGQPAADDADDEVGEVLQDLFGPDTPRVVELANVLDEHHPHEPLYYLQFLGVVPGRQGQGVGSALLEAVLRRCDEDGLPAFLDATGPDNRRLYQRHDFRVIAEVAPASGPPLWPMLRAPQPLRTS